MIYFLSQVPEESVSLVGSSLAHPTELNTQPGDTKHNSDAFTNPEAREDVDESRF